MGEALAGSQAAYRELVRRYQGPVLNLVAHMVRDRSEAEDLTQEVFVKAFARLGTYDTTRRFASWVFKIAHNHTIDHLRRRQLDTVSLDGSPHAATASDIEATTLDARDRNESALDELESREIGTAIEAAIARLRPEYRSCILLRHVEGRSYEEIAATLDLPLGTVKTYIHRARHELRHTLGHLRE